MGAAITLDMLKHPLPVVLKSRKYSFSKIRKMVAVIYYKEVGLPPTPILEFIYSPSTSILILS